MALNRRDFILDKFSIFVNLKRAFTFKLKKTKNCAIII